MELLEVEPHARDRPRTPTHTSVPTPYDKRLMVFAGRGSQELGAQDRRQARDRAGPGRAEDLLQRRGLLPLPGVDPRRGRVHRAVDARAREPQPDGAAADDRRGEGRLRAPDHRGHALVRLLAPGQEVDAARADLGPPRGAHARDGRRRPRADDAPARRPGAGLLPDPGGPPDRAPDADAVLPRQARAGGVRGRVAGRRPREAGGEVRRRAGREARLHHQVAARAQHRRGRLRGRRRRGQGGDPRRRHDRHGRHAGRGGAGAARGRRGARVRDRDARRVLRPRVRAARRARRSRRSSSPTRSRCRPTRPTRSRC